MKITIFYEENEELQEKRKIEHLISLYNAQELFIEDENLDMINFHKASIETLKFAISAAQGHVKTNLNDIFIKLLNIRLNRLIEIQEESAKRLRKLYKNGKLRWMDDPFNKLISDMNVGLLNTNLASLKEGYYTEACGNLDSVWIKILEKELRSKKQAEAMKSKMWPSSDGPIHVEKMSGTRINNCMQRLENKTKKGSFEFNWLRIFYEELKRRRSFEKQEMLEKAKKDYPVGTVFRSLINPDQIQEITEATHSIKIADDGDLYVIARTDKHFGGGCIFFNGRWAEILELKFVSEDGVNIYDGMETYLINEHDTPFFTHSIWGGNLKDHKYFYYRENAEQYIEDIKRKEKLLIEARKRYPIGTKFLSATNSSVKSFYTVNNEVIWEKNRIVAEKFGAAVYDDNQSRWAEIIGKTLVEQLDQLILMTPSGEIRNILSEALIQVQMNEKCIILTKNDLKNLAPFNIHDVTWQDFKESSITKQEFREAEVVIFIYESLSKVLKNKY